MASSSTIVRSTTPRFPISIVMQRTGITEFTLRAWENRHGAVLPARSRGRQRLYSDADVERLTLLAAITGDGFSISSVAALSLDELRRLAPAAASDLASAASNAREAAAQAVRQVQEGDTLALAQELAVCRRAVVSLNADQLSQVLMRQMLERGPMSFLEEVASPLCGWIGDEWSVGRLSEAQEHAASEILRRVFGFMLQTLRRERREHHVVVTTLAGERHEFGAMMAAIIAAADGWSYSYLGPDLPALAIASAVKRLDAQIIAVSVIAPRVAAQPGRELVALRRAVGKRREIFVGGSSAAVVDHVLHTTRATRVESLTAWRELLADRLRLA